MKIEPELKNAIKAKCKMQPPIDWHTRRKAEQAAITDFIHSKPKAASRIASILKAKKELKAQAEKIQSKINAFRKELCDKFGLRESGDNDAPLEFARCDSSNEQFEKAGGKIPVLMNWTYDAMIARIASATPEEGKKILAEIGINWS